MDYLGLLRRFGRFRLPLAPIVDRRTDQFLDEIFFDDFFVEENLSQSVEFIAVMDQLGFGPFPPPDATDGRFPRQSLAPYVR